MVHVSSEGLTQFHSQQGNWGLSHRLLTYPESTVADTFWLNALSDDYRYFDEQPLFTESRNAEIIRIGFFESFHNHTLFKFTKRELEVELVEKELKDQIIHWEHDSLITTMRYYQFNSTDDTIYEYQRTHGIQGSGIDEHVLVGEFDPIVSKEIRQIANSEWNGLVKAINAESFRKLPPTDQDCCSDGYKLVIEIHTPQGYHLYTRQNPKDSVTLEIIKRLLNLSGNQNFKALHGNIAK